MKCAWIIPFLFVCVSCGMLSRGGEDGWVELYNGKNFDGWRINENDDSWSIQDGIIVANGVRSHLFYVGDEQPYTNFELEVVAMTASGSNSGVFFHTEFQESGWPQVGIEAQVNNTQRDPQKTGSLWGVVKNLEAPAKDNEWFTMNVRVVGKIVVVTVDGKEILTYNEPEGKKSDDANSPRLQMLGKGTFCLQAHDPGSTVKYKSVRARHLP